MSLEFVSSDQTNLPSFRPYLIRAFYEWCVDNGFTPQIIASVEKDDDDCEVPREYVQDGKIAFNIAPKACGQLDIENDCIHFYASFSGEKRRVWLPIGNIIGIFARENGAYLPFDLVKPKKEEPPAKPTSGPIFSKV